MGTTRRSGNDPDHREPTKQQKTHQGTIRNLSRSLCSTS